MSTGDLVSDTGRMIHSMTSCSLLVLSYAETWPAAFPHALHMLADNCLVCLLHTMHGSVSCAQQFSREMRETNEATQLNGACMQAPTSSSCCAPR